MPQGYVPSAQIIQKDKSIWVYGDLVEVANQVDRLLAGGCWRLSGSPTFVEFSTDLGNFTKTLSVLVRHNSW